MNNLYIKASLIFIGGIACGSVATYAILKTKIQKKADEEVEEMRKYVADKLRPYGIAEKMSEKADEQAVSDIFEASENGSYVDYVQFYNPETDEIDQEVIDISVEEAENSPKRELRDKPYIITEDEFTDVLPYYDKVTLAYYPDGGFLMDELHDQSEEIGVVGEENLDIFRESDDTIIYVRNDRLSIDYEIEKILE